MPTQETPGGSAVSRAARLLLGGVPSLDWTLAHYTGEFLRDGDMIKCPLPGHDDSTPSFNLWAPDEDGVPQRFGCFGCGRGGDVLELIGLLEDGVDAIARGAELKLQEDSDTTPRERTTREVVEADLPTVYAEAQASPNPNFFSLYMTRKAMGGEPTEVYAMDEWGWVATGGQVVIPHRSRDGQITGLKYRALDSKWSEPGSRYLALYGAWRDEGRSKVVVCEGETDTLWAAWSLRDQDVDVLGIPSGVSQGITAEWLTQLEGREVTIMLDSDEAGREGAKAWYNARHDVRIARLPENEDVLSCGIPVTELVEQAEQVVPSLGNVDVMAGVFVGFKTVGRGDDAEKVTYPLGDFAFQPIRELRTPDGPAWEGYLTGVRELALLRGSDFSANAFPKWANRHGRAWLGTAKDIQSLHNWLKAEAAFLPLERTTTRAGKARRSYVGPDFCIGPDRIRYIPPVLGDAKLEGKIRIVAGEVDRIAIRALEQLNDPSVMATILGWLCATLMRGERAPAPPLFVSGESGAGKTQLIQSVLESFGFGIDVNLTTTTPFGVDCLVNSTVGFPVWFDEYRAGAREDSLMRLRQLLRDAYNGQASMKGGMSAQATELAEIRTWAGIIVSGEMGTQETSLRDRMVMIDLDPNKKQRPPYEWLRERNRTVALGHSLLKFLSERPDSLFRVEPSGPAHLPDRFREVMGFVQTGWDAWVEFRLQHGWDDVPVGPNFEDLAFGRDEADDPWLEAMRACIGVPVRDNSGAYIVEETSAAGEWRIVPIEVVVEARRVGIELPARANELNAWLKRRYDVREDRLPGGRRVKIVKGLAL